MSNINLSKEGIPELTRLKTPFMRRKHLKSPTPIKKWLEKIGTVGQCFKSRFLRPK